MKVATPDALVMLGQVLYLQVERNGRRTVLDWPPRRVQILATDETKKALWIFPAPKKRRKAANPDAAVLKTLAGVFRAWSDFEPENVDAVRLPTGGKWTFRGEVVRISYRSRKWSGRPEDWQHDFEGTARLVQLGNLFRISGGFAVKPAGITG